jgi:hypothetical protein
MTTGFSFASVILSYFLVGGGMFSATLVAGELRLGGEIAGYASLAVGAFVGAFIAARASRGQTILEPVIGAVGVIGTIVGLAATTPFGRLLWSFAQDETLKFVGAVGGTGVAGALIGAFLSEKLLGEATRSSIPWLVYAALSSFGASMLATLLASIAFLGIAANTEADLVAIILISIAAGCLIAGLAVGASARVRPLIASFLGGGAGVAGYFLLITRSLPPERDVAVGIAVLAAGGAVVALIGTALGWGIIGRRQAA